MCGWATVTNPAQTSLNPSAHWTSVWCHNDATLVHKEGQHRKNRATGGKHGLTEGGKPPLDGAAACPVTPATCLTWGPIQQVATPEGYAMVCVPVLTGQEVLTVRQQTLSLQHTHTNTRQAEAGRQAGRQHPHVTAADDRALCCMTMCYSTINTHSVPVWHHEKVAGHACSCEHAPKVCQGTHALPTTAAYCSCLVQQGSGSHGACLLTHVLKGVTQGVCAVEVAC